MGITRVTRNYQVTLPKDVREFSKLKEGDKLLISLEDHEVIRMRKLEEDDILKKAFGSWKKVRVPSVKYVRELRKGWSKRYKRLGLK